MNRKRSLDGLEQEIADHLALETQEHIDRGMSPAAARLAARRRFGSIALTIEDARAVWVPVWLEQLLQDVRFGTRMLLQQPLFSAIVLVTLALGIGATTAVLSAANNLFLRVLPVEDPGTLVKFRHVGRNTITSNSRDYGFSSPGPDGQNVRASFSYPMFQQFVDSTRTLASLFACAPYGRVHVAVDGQAEVATGFVSTGNYYEVLGVGSTIGRTILPADDRPAAAPVAMISHRYWRSRFGGAPDVIGRLIHVNQVPVTIVGVLPATFTGVQLAVGEPPDVSLPLSVEPQLNTQQLSLHEPTYWWLQVMGRLKPGVTAAQVQAELEPLFQRAGRAGFATYLAAMPEEERTKLANSNPMEVSRLRVEAGGRGIYEMNQADVRAVEILAGVVLLVLVVVCVNIANLLLARATARQRELAIRASIGAGRQRLIRQLLTESLTLAAIGGALGLALGCWAQPLLPGVAGRLAPLDWRFLASAFAVTATTGVAFGTGPALRASRYGLNTTLKSTGGSVSTASTLASRSLLVAQVAISLVVLIGAGAFLQTLRNLRTVEVGFDPDHLLLMRVNPQLNRYEEKRTVKVYEQLLDGFAAVPGVRAVALSQPALLSGAVNSAPFFVNGRSDVGGDREPPINRMIVSPSFFSTMGIPLKAGRGFTSHDQEQAPKVALLNEAGVRAYFADQSPLGQRFGTNLTQASQYEIVGVVGDVRYNSLRDAAPATIYVPFRQARVPTAVFEVRTVLNPSGTLGSLREAVRQVDPTLPLLDVITQREQMEGRFVQERMLAQAYVVFGLLALLIAAVGLFGLLAYSVTSRTHEMGIRLAIGAARGQVLRLVVGESMRLVAGGVVVGLVSAALAGRMVASQLFGVSSTDIRTQLVATASLVCVAFVAAYLPARRASRVDPMIALRQE